jgi:hypothetical protein
MNSIFDLTDSQKVKLLNKITKSLLRCITSNMLFPMIKTIYKEWNFSLQLLPTVMRLNVLMMESSEITYSGMRSGSPARSQLLYRLRSCVG